MKNSRDMRSVVLWLADTVVWVAVGVGCSSVGCPRGTVAEGHQCRSPQQGQRVGGNGAIDESAISESGSEPNGDNSSGKGGEAGSTHGSGTTAGRMPDAGSGDSRANGAANSGASASGSAGNGAAGGSVPAGEPCSSDGDGRCAESGAGKRETCQSGVWTLDAPCADDETCTTPASGEPSCQPLSALCVASSKAAVCDAQGTMLMCNSDGTATTITSCSNAKLCEAGLAARRCASCVPGTPMCNGKELQRCRSDGSGFVAESDCKSAPLCDQANGTCKSPVCEAGSYTCTGDSLDACKPDLTGYESRLCPPGLCDAQRKTCLICKPDTTMCAGSTLVTCDATGQRTNSGRTCSGDTAICDAASGSCVECRVTADCKTQHDCADASGCSRGKCTYRAKARKTAPGDGTTVHSGTENPDPIYVVFGNALFWIPNPEELEGSYGGFANTQQVSLSSYEKCPVAGTLIVERGDPVGFVYVSTGSELKWVKSPADLDTYCGGSANIKVVPTGSLSNSMFPPPRGICPVNRS